VTTDLGTSKADGLREAHFRAFGDRSCERAVAEQLAEVDERGWEIGGKCGGAEGGRRAVDASRGVRQVGSIEAHSQLGERAGRTGSVPGPVERAERPIEQLEPAFGVAMGGFDTGGLSTEDRLPISQTVLVREREALPEPREGSSGFRRGVSAP
jgi:hypothetical protein